jgi:hypothetical protein
MREKKIIRICGSDEWFLVFSAIDWSGVKPEEKHQAVGDLMDRIYDHLYDAGYEPVMAVTSCHHWNGLPGRICGGILRPAVELTVAESQQVNDIVYGAIDWVQQWHKVPAAE